MIRSYPNSALVAYPTKGKANAFTAPASKQVFLFNARAFNFSGSTINVGILKSLVTSEWKLWSYVNSGAVYTNVTSTIQTPAATAVFAGATSDGFLVQCNDRFGMLGFTISTAQAGGVFTYKYWNGSTYTTLTTLEVPTDYSVAADTWVVFQAPTDWVVGGTGVTAGMYTILVQSSTAPAGAVSINALWTGQFLEYYKGVTANSGVQLSFPDSKPYLLNGGEGIFAYFSTAAAGNQVGAYYAVTG